MRNSVTKVTMRARGECGSDFLGDHLYQEAHCMKANKKRRAQTVSMTFAASLRKPESLLRLRHKKNASVTNPSPIESQPHPVGFTATLLAASIIIRSLIYP